MVEYGASSFEENPDTDENAAGDPIKLTDDAVVLAEAKQAELEARLRDIPTPAGLPAARAAFASFTACSNGAW